MYRLKILSFLLFVVLLSACSDDSQLNDQKGFSVAASVPDETETEDIAVDHQAATNGLMGAVETEKVEIQPRTKRTETFYSVAPETVLVRVGEAKLTKKDVLDEIALMCTLFAHRSGKNIQESTAAKIRKNLRATITSRFVNRELAYYSAHTNVLGNVSDLAANAVKGRYADKFCRNGETFDDLLKILPENQRQIINRLFVQESEVETYIRNEFPSNLVVTAEELTNAINRIERWNASVSQTNEWAYTTASNILHLARRKGADFAQLADEYSQEEDKLPGGLLENATDADFSNLGISYLDELKKMKPGQISDILETNEGLQIVQCVSYDVLLDEAVFRRIILPIGVLYPKESEDIDSLTKLGLKQGRQLAVTELIRASRKVLKPWYFESKNFISE